MVRFVVSVCLFVISFSTLVLISTIYYCINWMNILYLFLTSPIHILISGTCCLVTFIFYFFKIFNFRIFKVEMNKEDMEEKFKALRIARFVFVAYLNLALLAVFGLVFELIFLFFIDFNWIIFECFWAKKFEE